MPSATGIPALPVSASRRSTSRARSCVSPQAVVMPRISSSGLVSARPTAKASSTSSPMSVSMMIFVFAAVVGGILCAEDCARSTEAAANNRAITAHDARIKNLFRDAIDIIAAGSITPAGHLRKLLQRWVVDQFAVIAFIGSNVPTGGTRGESLRKAALSFKGEYFVRGSFKGHCWG